MTTEQVYRILFKFLLNVCHNQTNCGCGCPWGKSIKDNGFYGWHYVCTLK